MVGELPIASQDKPYIDALVSQVPCDPKSIRSPSIISRKRLVEQLGEPEDYDPKRKLRRLMSPEPLLLPRNHLSDRRAANNRTVLNKTLHLPLNQETEPDHSFTPDGRGIRPDSFRTDALLQAEDPAPDGSRWHGTPQHEDSPNSPFHPKVKQTDWSIKHTPIAPNEDGLKPTSSQATNRTNEQPLGAVKIGNEPPPPKGHGLGTVGATMNEAKLQGFITLRNKTVAEDSQRLTPEVDSPSRLPTPEASSGHDRRTLPPDVMRVAAYSFGRGDPLGPPATTHRYIASFDLVQKRGLAFQLLSRDVCDAELIEREALTDVDLIIDAGAAVLFFAISLLPTKANELSDRIARLSWRYTKLLLVFEAYPSSRSRTTSFRASTEDGLTPYAFSPPVLKALKQFRRSMVIAESLGSKSPSCGTELVFALDEVEAARYTRLFADHRAVDCSGGTDRAMGGPWDDRAWLVEDIYEVRLISLLGENSPQLVPHHVRVKQNLPSLKE